MKKLFTLIAAITITLTGMAQGKSNGKGHNKNKNEKHASSKRDDDNERRDDDNERRNDNEGRKKGNEDRRYDQNNTNNNDIFQQGQDQNNNGKYAKNLPAKVRAAFNRDYPNAANVTWTKSKGYWTASIPNGIYRRKATYASNGQRINGPTRRTSYNSNEGSIWDKILSKQ